MRNSFQKKISSNSTSLAKAGLGRGLGGGGGVLTFGGGLFEPGRKNGLLATPPQQREESTKNKKALRYK